MSFKRISVIGLGYIGLPTAAVFASRKIEVIGVDVNKDTVDTINRGEIHIVEPDLDMVVHAAVTEGYLKAVLTPEPADAFLIAVPTPFKGDHEPDLSFIEASAKAIAPVLETGNLVILESTSPVGTTEQLAEWLSKERPDLTFPESEGEASDVRVAHCPERVLPGHVLHELVHNDRVIGGLTPKCSDMAAALYKIFLEGECVITNARTAEMAKLTENSFRDVNIAFANELSLICDRLNINVWELIRLANRHPRVNILQPGPGVGGHCIAVDPWFIVAETPDLAKLISTSRQVNESKPGWVFNQAKNKFAAFLKNNPAKNAHNIKIAIYGLAFKPDIDDLRESPSVGIANMILKEFNESEIMVVEPNIRELPSSLKGVSLVALDYALVEADIHMILVDHKEFKDGIRLMKSEYVVDTKGLLTVN